MIAVILMVVGAILAVIGFIGLFALMMEPLHTMYMVIFKRKDDYVYYETKPGKALLRKEKKALMGSCLFMLITGILCFGLGCFLKYGPRGRDSLFSEQVENGVGIGDDERENELEGHVNEAGNYVDAEGNEHTRYIVVRGTKIRCQEDFEGSIEEFSDYVDQIGLGEEVYLVDDYASSRIYQAVEELLGQKRIPYRTGR